ncbi:hypothetical protein KFK09_004571 [Dendrobium nobile]|uniref:Reverse transcriptase Ty1/copia-type domain-containing protein n=1 Tax=Dendrobium nobile TaxID=94219 RepID=A0A8T3C118_DENNO|nr:hypothetical protein KFK09_004571 [Dendrobium nobile]
METPSQSSTSSQTLAVVKKADVAIPSQLKFLMTNVKSVLNIQLTADSYPLWKSQILKLFTANGFDGYLDGSTPKPTKFLSTDPKIVPNLEYYTWLLVDQNLAAVLYSTISTTFLPYVLNLDSCLEIWQTIERRLQSTNCSRILQLKNELHHISMKDKSMMQYLSEIKSKIDAIGSSSSPLPSEDIILHTLNGLPSAYQAFKTVIRINLNPISLDDFYSLLCSEELNLAVEAVRDISITTPSSEPVQAFTTQRGRARGRNYRGRSSSWPYRGRSSSGRGASSSQPFVECQICGESGHSAFKCWYRADFSLPPPIPAYSADSSQQSSDWLLDTGATSHLTLDPAQVYNPKPYAGHQQVMIGNGDLLPITHTVKHSVWRKAMSDEFDALQQQATWILVPPHPTQNVLGSKWIYKTKLKIDGTIARYKARLVSQGCSQQYGLVYLQTFSPVAKLPTIRILLSVATNFKWDIIQLDVSNAFLLGHLKDNVYMSQPSGFKDSLHPDYVCLLKKSIYGLKQSPRQWFETFSTYLLTYGFKHSTADPSLLIYNKQSAVLYILVYVDDILLTSNDTTVINHLLNGLSHKFRMKNLGRISYFLGM